MKSLLVASLILACVSAQEITGQYTCEAAGLYTLCQNLWGESAGTGSQTSTLVSNNDNSVSWFTNWTWADNSNNVKSFANTIHNTAKGVRLQDITSLPTIWTWSYDKISDGTRADVSYDIWLGSAQSGDPASSASSYEIMIWLSGKGGAQPIGSQITTGTSLAGHTWNLWKGPNKNWEVFSFVSSAGDITNFNADLKNFFNYLVQNQGVAATQYVQAIQAGTEPFVGSADLSVHSYWVKINS